MKTLFFLSFLSLTISPVLAQDFDGCCNTKKVGIFERLAQDIDAIITTMGRNSWNQAMKVKEKDWPFAAFLLRYSLQDSPQDLSFSPESRATQLIKKSSEYQQILANIKANLLMTTDQEVVQGALVLPFTTGDLAVALHNTTLNYTAKKVDDAWVINITISDLYDFKHHTPSEIASFKVRVLNNMAYRDQEMGIITPYDVSFAIEETIAIPKQNPFDF